MKPDKEIARILRDWYAENKRDLPWRNTRDPYRIWISEIILQQTRVAQGMDYYHRFTERFPDVRTLAEAESDEVMKYWQGLGYYSRARNLHAAAKTILAEHNGCFPTDHISIRALKGIGDYTSAAIASIAFDLPHATVDGNVYRLLSRLFGLDIPIDSPKGQKEYARFADDLLDKEDPATHNQAMMEFGALFCTPKSPDCPNCPLREKCLSWADNGVANRPVKTQKTKVRPRYFYYLCITDGKRLLLNRRSEKDIWQNLYEFPLIETPEPVQSEELFRHPDYLQLFTGCADMQILPRTDMPRHVLSHQVIHASFYEVRILAFTAGMDRYLQVGESQLGDYAVSRLMELYLEKRKSLQYALPL